IDLVVRHAARGAPGALRLDDAVRAALAELEPTARAIVQLTALAAGGVAQRTVAHALALDGGTLERHLCVLCAASWIRIASGALTGPIEPYHARIRAGVLASLRDDEAHALRHALAGALSRDRDPDHDAAPDPPPRTWLQLYPHQVSGPVR
ncbi:MAG TPA: hypothetical protein VFP84_29220, partial [Kofleriaceae bacterium]|nr:hypothetical protein [Kofleriaceae bacterium]